MRFFDARPYIFNEYPFVIIIGGRGIGKTYSCLRTVTKEKIQHLYLRNSDRQIEICSTAMGNPYKAINSDFNTHYSFKTTKEKVSMIIDEDNNNSIIGYGCALSTFGNLRGVSLEEVEVVIHDEFLDIKHGKNQQADWFFNMYETVNRNRELLGKKPLKVVMLANSMSLENSILSQFGVINIIESMLANGQRKTSIPEKGIMILLPYLDDLANAKSNTALYRATADSAYFQMAINNEFVENDFSNIKKKVALYEYIPICSYCGIYIYVHKNNGRMYACRTYANCPSFNEHSKLSFKRNFGVHLKTCIIDGKMEFSDYSAKFTLTSALF